MQFLTVIHGIKCMPTFIDVPWTYTSLRQNPGSSWDSTQDLLNTSLMLLSLSHLDPWQRSGRQDALPRGLSRIPTDSHSMQGWTELKLWLNFATFKGSVVTRVVPLAVLVAGWW